MTCGVDDIGMVASGFVEGDMASCFVVIDMVL
jgi:hypothetical protein